MTKRCLASESGGGEAEETGHREWGGGKGKGKGKGKG